MTMTAGPLTEYPKTWVLAEGTKAVVRPMLREDRDRLALFFKRIPEEELHFLKDDVTDLRIIDRWIETLDYNRVLPLIVEVGSRIVADASLHRRREGWRRHLGGVRVVVDPAYRHKGLAAGLIVELIDIAGREGLERLYAEIPADDAGAVEVFENRGFKQVARFDRNIVDRTGEYHDLTVYHLDLAEKR
ncbi:MAG: GNAT family N-acetyltransferase [Candidatus Methylomirabilales bacterium]